MGHTLLTQGSGEEMGNCSVIGKYKEPPTPDTQNTHQTGAEQFFFSFLFFLFFEMCNCVKLVWFQIYTEMWAHLVFIQTNSS